MKALEVGHAPCDRQRLFQRGLHRINLFTQASCDLPLCFLSEPLSLLKLMISDKLGAFQVSFKRS